MSISVMLPTFNRLESLKIAINSVISQSLAVDEIVVADAGSSDGTIDYLKKLKNNNTLKIKLVGKSKRLENWLDGINNCTNDYVLILCDDDIIHPFLVENFNRVQKINPNASMFCFRQQIVYLNYELPKTSITKKWDEGYFVGKKAEHQLVENGFPGSPSIIINKNKLHFDHAALSVFEEADYLCDLFLAPQSLLNGGIVFDNYIASTFYYHPNSQSIVQGLSLFYPIWDKKITRLQFEGLILLEKHFTRRFQKRLLATLVSTSYREGRNGVDLMCTQLENYIDLIRIKKLPRLIILVARNSFFRQILKLSYLVKKFLT